MSKIGIVFYSGTGKTRKLVEVFEKAAQEAGAAVSKYRVSDEVDVEDVFSSDVVALACSACGDEVIEQHFFKPFMENNKERFNGKKVYIFGTYGWGNGVFADAWREQIEGFGATIADMPVLVNETANEMEIEQLEMIARKLAN